MKRSGGLVTFSILLFLAIYQEQSRGEFIADTGEVFDTVARNIDPGGLYFLICNTQTILANLEEKLSGARDSAIAVQGLSIEEKEKLRTQFAFGMRILLGSGLQNIKAFGASSKQDADGFFVNKIFVFGPSDMLWSALTNPEHDLYLNQLAPAETATFALFDLDIATLWRRLSRDLEGEQNQEITRWVRQIPKQVEGITGLSLEDLLGSVGTQFGYLLTLDPEKKVTIPVATETYQLPEPAAAFICQVRDTK
ncbi:MAG: hypothetical protein JOY96_01495, partial [Verrucomicrobia bacterium]|nr:hypothetical protein [Verrucomicrobiota bacterium]